LAFLGAWSTLASFVPQGSASDAKVAAWAAANPVIEPVARTVGMHDAFAAPLFAACVSVLALSTMLCAWQRTRLAFGKGRALRGAWAVDGQELTARHDLAITCDASLAAPAALSLASETLGRLGIRTKRRGDVIIAASPWWSVWGSPAFHWALLALIVTLALGGMLRSSGQMGLAVGQAKADVPQAYGILSAGPLHSWFSAQRTIRVDAFEIDFKTGGIDRGPTPTVTILDARGAVIKSQRVYPNNTLQVGSLTVYPADYGLAATVSLVDTNGAESGRSTQFVDFSSEASGGTAPAGHLTVGDATGRPALEVFISVPLDRVTGGLVARLPEDPRVRVVVATMDSKAVIDQVMRPGEQLELPTGGALRLLDLGYYARLQLVDDPSIPVLYAVLAVAMIGLGVSTLMREQTVSVAAVESPDGVSIVVRMRLWRNVTTSRTEIESELTKALCGAEKGDTT
jgi:cytochrome c biogenesis protein